MGGGVRVESFSAWLDGKLDVYFDRLCKTLPSGRIFPLPSSSIYLSQVFSHLPPAVIRMLRVLVVSLNSLNSEGLWNDQEGPLFRLKCWKVWFRIAKDFLPGM